MRSPSTPKAPASGPRLSDAVIRRELLGLLSFNLDDGRIWLFGKRMLMLDAESFTTLRHALITHLGIPTARGVLTRIGYASGQSDARLIRARWPKEYQQHAAIGSYLHRLEGIAKIVPVRVNSVPERGHFDAEYEWHHTIEDDAHIVSHGLGADPACWMEVGYATGYVSTMCDQLILFREVECRSMGSSVCRVLGGPAADFGDIDEDLEFLGLPNPKRPRAKAPAPAGAEGGWKSSNSMGELERPIVGRSASLTAARALLARVAPTRATVLVTGESGVGKELFARALHELSPRRKNPFVAVNCAAIPDTLIEAELFGVERGAFTGAQSSRAGRFERAAGGTLFLDEVAALSPVAQTKLLRVLQEGEVERLGGNRVLRPDVRVVAAANIDLREAVARGSFREDLFFRLNVFPIELPPLRERRDDIPELVAHFVAKYNALHARTIANLTPRAMEMLLGNHYPGNIRELERIIERAIILADGDTLDSPHVQVPRASARSPGQLVLAGRESLSLQESGTEKTLDEAIDKLAEHVLDALSDAQGAPIFEQIGDTLLERIATQAMERAGGNLSATARLLGVRRHQVEYRVRQHQEKLSMQERGISEPVTR